MHAVVLLAQIQFQLLLPDISAGQNGNIYEYRYSIQIAIANSKESSSLKCVPTEMVYGIDFPAIQ